MHSIVFPYALEDVQFVLQNRLFAIIRAYYDGQLTNYHCVCDHSNDHQDAAENNLHVCLGCAISIAHCRDGRQDKVHRVQVLIKLRT